MLVYFLYVRQVVDRAKLLSAIYTTDFAFIHFTNTAFTMGHEFSVCSGYGTKHNGPEILSLEPWQSLG